MIVAENREHLEQLVNIEVFKKNNLKLDEIDVSNITDFRALFENKTFNKIHGSIEDWNVSNGLYFAEMFSESKNIWFNFKNWNMTNAIDCSHMFSDCHDFEGKGLEFWNLRNVIDCSYMFFDCQNLDIDVSNWDMSNAINFEYMFKRCYKFRGIGLDKWKIHIKDLEKEISENKFNKVYYFSMYSMFEDCERLDFDISNWRFEIKEYGQFEYMFSRCYNFKGKGLDKKTFKSDNNYIFLDCYNLQSVPKIDSKEKFVYADYFRNCYNLEFIKNNEDLELIDILNSSRISTIKLKEPPYKIKNKSLLPKLFSESNFSNIYPVIHDEHIFINRRHKVKRNNGKNLLGFANIKIIDSKVDPKNLRLCSFYKDNFNELEKDSKKYMFYRIKNMNILSNSPNSISKKFNYDEKNFFNKKNIFLNKSFYNKYLCWK